MRASVALAIGAAGVIAAACTPASIESQGRESPAQVRRILAQAVCLAEAYPGTAVAADSASVVAVYQGVLGERVTAMDIAAVRALAQAAKPAAPTPVGERNLAIARCVLFADRPDVMTRLGG